MSAQDRFSDEFKKDAVSQVVDRGYLVAEVAERLGVNTRSIGMSLDTCTVAGSPKELRSPQGKAELGLGIHGEAGVEQVDYTDARQAVEAMAGKLVATLTDGPQVALLNNLGGASVLEMSVLACDRRDRDRSAASACRGRLGCRAGSGRPR